MPSCSAYGSASSAEVLPFGWKDAEATGGMALDDILQHGLAHEQPCAVRELADSAGGASIHSSFS